MWNIITDDTTPEELEEMKRRMPPRRADAPPLPPGKPFKMASIKLLDPDSNIDPIAAVRAMRDEDR